MPRPLTIVGGRSSKKPLVSPAWIYTGVVVAVFIIYYRFTDFGSTDRRRMYFQGESRPVLGAFAGGSGSDQCLLPQGNWANTCDDTLVIEGPCQGRCVLKATCEQHAGTYIPSTLEYPAGTVLEIKNINGLLCQTGEVPNCGLNYHRSLKTCIDGAIPTRKVPNANWRGRADADPDLNNGVDDFHGDTEFQGFKVKNKDDDEWAANVDEDTGEWSKKRRMWDEEARGGKHQRSDADEAGGRGKKQRWAEDDDDDDDDEDEKDVRSGRQRHDDRGAREHEADRDSYHDSHRRERNQREHEDREYGQDRGADYEVDRDREHERARDHDRDRDRDADRGHDRDRDRDRERDHFDPERDYNREHDRDRDPDRDHGRDPDRDHDQREREHDRDHDRDRDFDRERERDRDEERDRGRGDRDHSEHEREREREREHDRDRERDREREYDHRRGVDRDQDWHRDPEDDDRDRHLRGWNERARH